MSTGPRTSRVTRPVLVAIGVLAVLLTGCGEDGGDPPAQYGDWTAADGPIAAAVLHPDRPADDRARDIARKPIEVLRSFGIEPGQTVFEFYAGSGWYSEILVRAIGPEGTLVLHNNPLFAEYFGEAFEARNLLGRFDNVEYKAVAPAALMLKSDRYDRALIILSYHDLLYPPENGAPAPDRARLLREIFDGLKPGGLLGVVDHAGPSNVAPREMGEELHRLDPGLLRQEAEAVGFVFDGSSDVLANSDDDHSVPIFEVERGTTDRFVYRFRKPQ